MNRVLILVDSKNSGEAFWRHVSSAAGAPAALLEIASGVADEQLVTAQEAQEIEAWCKRALGWSDGPAYAPHPIIFERLRDEAQIR